MPETGAEPMELGTTRQERLERWRTLLSGTARTAGAQRVYANREANLLGAIVVRAAARKEHGLLLTDLEQSLLDMIGRVLAEDEVAEIGRIYLEQIRNHAGLEALPDRITGLNLSRGYDSEDFRADLRDISPRLSALPNVAVLDRTTLSEGIKTYPEGFWEAVRRHGHGVTIFAPHARPANLGTEEDTPGATFHAAFDMTGFDCRQSSGDQQGGRREVYWTATTNTHTYRSTGTGPMVSGRSYAIPGDHRFYDDQLRGHALLTITSWEADHPAPAWYKALDEALRIISTTLGLTADSQSLTGDLIGYAQTAATFLHQFWEPLHNTDHLVCTHALILRRTDIETLCDHPTRELTCRFDGRGAAGGLFDLTIHYAGQQPPRGLTARHKVLRDGRWSDLPAPTWNVTTPPALASHTDGQLHAVFADEGHLLHATWREPGTWSIPTKIMTDGQPLRTWRKPALASHHGLLHLVYCDPTDLMLCWAHLTPDGEWRSSKRTGLPATELDLTVDAQGTLWLLELHGDSTASVNEYLPDTNRYEARISPARHIDTTKSSALVALNDHLLLSTPRRNGTIRTLHFNGSGYTPVTELGHEALNTSTGLAMRTHKGMLHLVIPGNEGGLRWAQGAFSAAGTTFRGIVWGPAQRIPTPLASHPSLAEHDSDLHLTYLQSPQ